MELTLVALEGRSGSTSGWLVTLVDISAWQQREVETRHAQKLEALGRLSAGLAHEINTPIQFVGDNTRFLAEAYLTMVNLLQTYRDVLSGASGSLPWAERQALVEEAERAADLDFIEQEVPVAIEQSLEGVERVADLVRAMKAFSYKDQGQAAHADLNEALRVTATVARNETKYNADLHLDLNDLPPVRCRLGDLNQVFLNLVVNAADAIAETGRRGSITLSSQCVGDHVVIEVRDDGPGIPPDVLPKVFDPFFTTKPVGKGTGQGLALARSVVRDGHGGELRVKSVVGQGTCFSVHLPVDGPEVGAASDETALSEQAA